MDISGAVMILATLDSVLASFVGWAMGSAVVAGWVVSFCAARILFWRIADRHEAMQREGSGSI